MNSKECLKFVEDRWDNDILHVLSRYIEVPNQSPQFDPDWESNGLIDSAMDLLAGWCRDQPIQGMKVDVLEEPGRSPLLFIEIPGQKDGTVLLYGHMDKQPPFTGWEDGLGPYTPVIRNGRLYGRGAADDGYSVFSALTAIRAVRELGEHHARCVVLIEASEESFSRDLPYYIDRLTSRIGTPDLVVCLDSLAGDYERLWCTTSLRGGIIALLRVSILREGVHSGDAGGIVPSSFMIARQVLDRLEDSESGRILISACHVEVPDLRRSEAAEVARIVGPLVEERFPWVDGAHSLASDHVELLLNSTWRPALAVTGADGIPPVQSGGNVIRPFTSFKLSLRVPPTCRVEEAAATVKEVLEADPPFGAEVRVDIVGTNTGWNAGPRAEWLERAMASASEIYFGNETGFIGVGGGIPLVNMLQEGFPDSQFLVTGVLGPGSNAHGPNEFLDIATAKRVTCCIAEVLVAHGS